MKTIKFLLAILVSFAIAACGGGGSSSPAPTYHISGTVTLSAAALSGVTITLSGASITTTTKTTLADGSYSFVGLANGTYTVAPSLAGDAFLPTQTVVIVSGNNVTGKDFVASVAAATYSISGTVSGAATSGVTIDLGAAGSVLTGTGGTYTISGLVAGSYTLTPTLAGFTFSPTSLPVTITAANLTANDFAATAVPLPHSISGTVSGSTLSGVTITVTGGTANTGATTDASGNYTVTGLYDASYTVTPTKTGFTFTPSSTSVTMSGANQTGKNFTSAVYTAPTYTLSGAVTGPYVEGVTITLGGAGSATTTTTASGNYSFANLPTGTYNLLPSLSGYNYSPSNPAVTIVSANMTRNFVASSAIASYSITGTVSKTTAAGAPIAIIVYPNSCGGCGVVGGTVIAGVGTYTVRGLQPGGYTVVAEMDALGTGMPNATNPMGMTTATITSSSVTGVDIVVANPTTNAPVMPTMQGVAPGNGSAFVMYSPPKDGNNQEIATSYKIYWGTTTATTGGSATFTAQGDKQNFYVLSGLTDTAHLYFKMSAFVGATESAPSAAFGPVTIGATTGANTVSGTVTFSGSASGKTMMVGLFSNTGVYITRIPSPVSPQSYSIAGVPNGSYYHFAIIDMNNNGVIDTGDISNTNSNAGDITVSGNTTSSLTLSSASATATVNTDHQFDGTNSYYSLILGINDGTKRAVAVTLVSGPNMAVPYDMGVDSGNSRWIWLNTVSPTVGDAYMFKVTYSNGTTENLSGSVAGVLGLSKFVPSLATVTSGGGSSATVPLFTWTAPASLPTSSTYRLHLNGNNDSTNWDFPKDNGLPSTTTPLQVLYNADGRASGPLTSGYSYNWQVQVRDANGDSATRTATYTVP